MKKIFTRALSLVVILSVLCCSLVFVTSAVSSHTTQVLELSKTEHSSCTDTGSIVFADGIYAFKNSIAVLGTGPILGKNVGDFTWEFDYASDDPSWRQECFMFHANSDGIYESDTYTLRIEGNGMFGGIRLFKNADYNNPIATYKPEGGILTKSWDGHIWHTKIEVKNNQCKIWFYNINNPATTEPVITVDLGNAELTSGDFKVQGYGANMMLDNMVIKTDDVDYYFDPDDAPADSGNSGGNTGDDGNDDEGGNKVITLGKTEHSSCTSPGSINFADGWYKFENAGNHVLGTGPILGKNVGDFTWEFDYGSNDPSWRQECFIFHANSDGVYESDAYILRIEGNGNFGGIRLFKNADYNNPIATYKPAGGILTKTWDGHIWHTKIEVKDNLCKIWFYNINNPATTEPVITVDLGNAELTSGDFKVQGYGANMMLDNMVIKTDDGNYYFDAADVPICLHTNTKEVVTKEATYFTEGSKNIVCSECAKKLEKDVVIYCDKANPVVFEEPVLNPATNQLKVEWEYSDALAIDLFNATTKELVVKFAFGDKEYSLKLDDVDDLGQVIYIEGINAARFAQNFSISLEFVVDAYNTTELNAAAKSLAVKVSDTIDASNEKADEYAKLIEEIAKVDEAVVAGEGQDNNDFTAGASKVDIAAGIAEIKFVATQDLIDTLKAKSQYNDGRKVTLVITIGEESHEIELAKLMSSITVKISGLSFDQMYGKISAKLVIDYAEIEDITTETVEFDFVNSINNSDNAVATALKTLLG